MKLLVCLAVTMVACTGLTPAMAQTNNDKQTDASQNKLVVTPVVAAATRPDRIPSARNYDPGANASANAIARVCSKDTPASERSAICTSGPISR